MGRKDHTPEGKKMTDKEIKATFNHVVYAQAVQIALTLSGQKENFDPMFAMDSMVERYLEKHRNLTNQVYAYLLSQQLIVQ
jgi:hypothetical protein